MVRDQEPKPFFSVQTINRRNETLGVRKVPVEELPKRFLRDSKVQDLIKAIDQSTDTSVPVAAIIERGRRPISVIPLQVNARLLIPTP